MKFEDAYVDGTDYDYLNWRAVPGYDGWYEASVDGEIRSWRNAGHGRRKEPKLLLPSFSKRRMQYTVVLTKNKEKRTYPVIRVVAMAFYGAIMPNMMVYHKNGDIGDNSLNNIAIREKNRAYREINKNSHQRKPVLKVDKDGEIIDAYKSVEDAARKNFMCNYQITCHCNKKVKNPFKFMDYTFRWDR